jgi:hypothetical protein
MRNVRKYFFFENGTVKGRGGEGGNRKGRTYRKRISKLYKSVKKL